MDIHPFLQEGDASVEEIMKTRGKVYRPTFNLIGREITEPLASKAPIRVRVNTHLSAATSLAAFRRPARFRRFSNLFELSLTTMRQVRDPFTELFKFSLKFKVSERSERAFWKTSILAMKCATWLQT